MKSFALSLLCVNKVKKKFQVKKVLTHGFYGMLEKGILCLFRNKKVMALHKTFLIPPKKLGLIHFY